MNVIFPRMAAVLLLAIGLCQAPALRASEEGEELRAADAALNTAYKATVSAMPDAGAKEKLREAQRAWISFRDAEIALNAGLPGASGNTLKMLQTALTQARTKQLKALAQAVRDGGIE